MKYPVNYDILEQFKKDCISKFSKTLNFPKNKGIKIVKQSKGCTAIAIDINKGDFYLAFNVEGLGTKSRVVELMTMERMMQKFEFTKEDMYAGLMQCTMAMSINDIAGIGGVPFAYGSIISLGDANYLSDEKISSGIIKGLGLSAKKSGVAIPCGETPVLEGIIKKNAIDFAGASIGIIEPKSKLCVGQNLEPGLVIYGLKSSGLHSNGYSLARKIAEKIKDKYFAEMPSGNIFGIELLQPTPLYSNLVEQLAKEKAEITFMQPITGHGFRKIMRTKKDLTYVIDSPPEPQEIFQFMQEKGKVSDYDAYQTFNMGVGFVLIARYSEATKIQNACKKAGLEYALTIGHTEKGKRQVVIPSKNIIYTPEK